MTSLIRRHPYLVAAFALASTLALYFAVSAIVGAIYWSQHRNEPVSPWMTVGYVGRSWGLKPQLIDEVAGLPLPKGHPMTLAEIAKERGVPVEEVIALVEAAVAELKGRAE